MRKKTNIKDIASLCVTIGVLIFAINVQFFASSETLFTMLNLAAILIGLGIPVTYRYMEYRLIKKIETIFPVYLSDIASKIATGMTLPQAIKTVTHNEYNELNPYVQEIHAKINWGIPFAKVLSDFGESIGTKEMKRNVQTIIETHKSGGEINIVLESVSNSLQELEKIKKERSASVYSQIINGYVIYFVFLGVMVGLTSFLIPTFQQADSAGFFQLSLNTTFQNLSVIQGVFAGLVIGKLSEGSVISGLKHALALGIIGYMVFFFFA